MFTTGTNKVKSQVLSRVQSVDVGKERENGAGTGSDGGSSGLRRERRNECVFVNLVCRFVVARKLSDHFFSQILLRKHANTCSSDSVSPKKTSGSDGVNAFRPSCWYVLSFKKSGFYFVVLFC